MENGGVGGSEPWRCEILPWTIEFSRYTVMCHGPVSVGEMSELRLRVLPYSTHTPQ